MDAAKFDTLVVRLENLSARKPNTYIALAIGVAAMGFAILGLAIGLALFTALLVGAVAFLIVTKVDVGLIVAGKLLILLLVPAFIMAKTSVTLLFARFPEPQGRKLTPAEAPRLFAALECLRRNMNGPPVHEVLLDDRLNASIVQHPRFGLFGWEKNILILGLPLLQVLSADEALSVVAHEYGHLSGHHSRLGGFIYRFRSTWRGLQALSEQWRDWGSRLVARLFRWYAPYFNAYTFVLARQNEYQADQAAVEAAGRRNAAIALMRVDIAGIFETAEFWPAVRRRVVAEAEPLASWTAFWQESIDGAFRGLLRAKFLEQARQRKTDHLDTHPALTDRLAAMGVAADDEALAQLQPPASTAAAQWLGATLEIVQAEFDRHWRDSVAANWHERHAYLRERRERLDHLDSLDTLTVEEQWERAQVLGEVRPEADVLPDVEAILAANPNHLPARFQRGTLVLERGDAAGIADLEAVMAVDRDAILPGCEAAWRYYDSGHRPGRAICEALARALRGRGTDQG